MELIKHRLLSMFTVAFAVALSSRSVLVHHRLYRQPQQLAFPRTLKNSLAVQAKRQKGEETLEKCPSRDRGATIAEHPTTGTRVTLTEKYLRPKETTFASKAQLTTPPLREAGLDQKETSKKELTNKSDSGTIASYNDQQDIVPHEVLNEARAEVRGAMLQYTQCADPTESVAYRERTRIAEEKGQLEESAMRVAQANLKEAEKADEEHPTEPELSPLRIPAALRLVPSNSQDAAETSKVVPGKKKLSRLRETQGSTKPKRTARN
ncbi:hypothetical protein Bca52824_051517 [Brassica carinata]|uniref:Uncharacterized protein n=1 Tax=Brassica carinata TaxID=52824 RepID=A0A8X7R274_BRACI|nr:hypothetical protein Bca52824_051517 [Brassica carinata]